MAGPGVAALDSQEPRGALGCLAGEAVADAALPGSYHQQTTNCLSRQRRAEVHGYNLPRHTREARVSTAPQLCGAAGKVLAMPTLGGRYHDYWLAA
jgi:hypothetical protein